MRRRNVQNWKAQISTVMIMDEMPKPRACFVLQRGQYDKQGEPVTAGMPAAFGTLPTGAPNNRLGLASGSSARTIR